jgi:hypothetical protein
MSEYHPLSTIAARGASRACTFVGFPLKAALLMGGTPFMP